MVAPADETLVSALKRASKLTSTSANLPREASEAAKARRRSAQQLDALTQQLAVPLGQVRAARATPPAPSVAPIA